MDLHVYRNAQDRWHHLRAASQERGAVLAVNAITLTELIEKLTPDLRVATIGQQVVFARRAGDGAASTRHLLDAITQLQNSHPDSEGEITGPILAAYTQNLQGNGLVDAAQRCWIAASRVRDYPNPWLARFERV